MRKEDVGPSGQQIQQDSAATVSGDGFPTGKHIQNVSMQTGEEFAWKFIQDRATSSRVPNGIDVSQGHLKHGRMNANRINQGQYEDLSGNLSLSRTESAGAYDVFDVALRKEYVLEGDNKFQSNKVSGYQNEIDLNRTGSDITFDEMSSRRVATGPMNPSVAASESPHFYHPYGSGHGSKPEKMKFLCSFGGKILPRPSDGKLRYVGGETRIINIRKDLSWLELVKKTSEICSQPHTIKYQLPGEDLDSLISVSSDEDLQNMIEEYHGFERIGGQRLRIFLISLNESESPCSFEGRAMERNHPEYQYVVAVNGILDPSPRKSSSGQNLAYQQGHYGNGTYPIEMKDAIGSSNMAGLFSYPSGNYFTASQNPTKSPYQSPPISPLSGYRDAHMQSSEDQLCDFSDESGAPCIREQLTPEKYSNDTARYFDPTHRPVPLIHRLDSNDKNADPEKANKLLGVHFHDLKPISHNAVSPAFVRNNSDLDAYSCDRPILKERAFHSEKLMSLAEDQTGLGSNDFESHHAMPHVHSDSQLQENAGNSIYCFHEGANTSSLSDFVNTLSPSGFNSIVQDENRGFSKKILWFLIAKFSRGNEQPVFGTHDSDERYRGANSFMNLIPVEQFVENTAVNFELLNLGDENDSLLHQHNEHHDMDHTMGSDSGSFGSHIFAKELLSPQNMMSIPSEFVYERQDLQYKSDVAASSQKFILIERKDSELGNTENKILPSTSFLWSRSSEAVDSDKLPQSGRELLSVEENLPTTSVCDSATGLISCASQWKEASRYHKEKGNGELVLTSSLNVASSVRVNADPNATEPSHIWPVQNTERDASSRVSLLGKVPLNYLDRHLIDKNPGGSSREPYTREDGALLGIEPLNDYGQQIHLESNLIVEDVTNVPLDIKSSSNVVPLVEDVAFEDIATDAESISPMSQSEDANVDDRDVDESISDAAIAEMEAGIYGLQVQAHLLNADGQIIKNADLEELRELGSGTFGTVYHGKWRGTDVAIKRIKKSCFAGRSSEQERLTKDFWREAQILSKLHHPNVVAFYGVVPDGAGGTLATVTEFMVNGSLRHVLLRKDRVLDRRKRLIIAMDAAFGMEYLHSKNIVHFDLKCDNLLVNLRDSHRPICKKCQLVFETILSARKSGGVRGTLPWMAPELLNGSSSRVSEKVDVFSFGIAMWEILTGEEPYANMHCGAIIGGIVSNTLRPPIPEKCDPEWRKLMEECWSPEPAARPSFTEITNRLRVMSMNFQAKGLKR
ncbi:hypothetical protein Syun_006542 [Stephania yunnanensis]|uniref:Protein kinase domain-containing protein n=1 Tax=Stephania yunnanensis TaxID=152371 RepID=A0AAP0KX27_9MAGN